MVTIRRWYIFLVCAVGLHSVAWAVIGLGQNLLTALGRSPLASMAFQLAVITIGLPIFLVHWLWAQRLAAADPDERASVLRRFYLYATLAGLLFPFLVSAFEAVASLLWLALGGSPAGRGFSGFTPGTSTVRAVVAMVVLAALWLYHARIISLDASAVPQAEGSATIRRLYVLIFSTTGLTMTVLGAIHLLRWMLYQFESSPAIRGFDLRVLTDEAALLFVGVPLWLAFWRWAQRLFYAPSEDERASALRKFYLYLVVFVAALSVVTQATLILAGGLRRLLALRPLGDLRQPLPIILLMVVVWAYHAYVLRGDAALAGEAPRQAGVRRLYLYLVAAVGLAALLAGLAGDVSVLIHWLDAPGVDIGLRDQLALATAGLIAGLPVWLLPWRKVQHTATNAGLNAEAERRSTVRKIYLYFYLFVATMTVLASAVYVLYRLLTLVLGAWQGRSLLSDVGQALAFCLIGVAVWIYHGLALRSDGRLGQREQAERLRAFRLAVADGGDGRFGCMLLEALRRDLPGVLARPFGLTPAAALAMGPNGGQSGEPFQLGEAELIIGPWTIAAPDANGIPPEAVSAIASSPARKLLVPFRAGNWEWAGVDAGPNEALLRQATRAVRQVVEGEDVRAGRPLSGGAIIAIVIGVLLLLSMVVPPLIGFLFFGGM